MIRITTLAGKRVAVFGLGSSGIATARGQGIPVQVKRTLEALKDAEGLIVD